MPDGQRCFVVSQAAIFGVAVRRIGPLHRLRFCDTDFIGTDGEQGGKYSESELVAVLRATWDSGVQGTGHPFVVFTGGEPTLQLNDALVEACQAIGFEVAIETNGTRIPPKPSTGSV